MCIKNDGFLAERGRRCNYANCNVNFYPNFLSKSVEIIYKTPLKRVIFNRKWHLYCNSKYSFAGFFITSGNDYLELQNKWPFFNKNLLFQGKFSSLSAFLIEKFENSWHIYCNSLRGLIDLMVALASTLPRARFGTIVARCTTRYTTTVRNPHSHHIVAFRYVSDSLVVSSGDAARRLLFAFKLMQFVRLSYPKNTHCARITIEYWGRRSRWRHHAS